MNTKQPNQPNQPNQPEILRNSLPIISMVQGLRNHIIDGEVDALAAFINLGRIEKVVSEVKKDESVLNCALSTYSRYNQKSITIGDCEVVEAEAGVKYDFSECGDTELDVLYRQQETIKAQIKERETFLKGVKRETLIADPQTGEMYAIYPPVKSSKTTLKLTFKKQ